MTKTYLEYRNEFLMALEKVVRDHQDLKHPRATSEHERFMAMARKIFNGDNAFTRGLTQCWERNNPIYEVAHEFFHVVMDDNLPLRTTLAELLAHIDQRHKPPSGPDTHLQ